LEGRWRWRASASALSALVAVVEVVVVAHHHQVVVAHRLSRIRWSNSFSFSTFTDFTDVDGLVAHIIIICTLLFLGMIGRLLLVSDIRELGIYVIPCSSSHSHIISYAYFVICHLYLSFISTSLLLPSTKTNSEDNNLIDSVDYQHKIISSSS
jgi:hypothetical protein